MIGKFQVAVAAGLSDLADLAGDPDLAGKRLEERAADPVVEVAYGERSIGHRPGDQRRLVGDDREERRRDGRDLRRRNRDRLPGMILAGSEIETKFLDIRTSSPPGPAGAGHGLRLPVGREWPSGSGSQQPSGGPNVPGPRVGSSTSPITEVREIAPRWTTYQTPLQEMSEAMANECTRPLISYESLDPETWK